MRSRKPQELPNALAEIATTGADLLAEADIPADWTIENVAEAGDVMLLSGREKDALKTMLAVDLLISRVEGGDWLGHKVAKASSGRVLYVSSETSPRAIARRLKKLCAGRGIDPARIANALVVVDEPISLVPREERDRRAEEAETRAKAAALKMIDPKQREQMLGSAGSIAKRETRSLGRNLDALAELEDAPEGSWSLIVFDTLRGALEGDENSSNDARSLMQAARELARTAGCVVLLIHHTSKAGDAADARSARGSVELTAAPDVIISIDTTGEHPTARYKMRNHEPPLPTGYSLVVGAESLRFELRDACAGGGARGDVSADDVLRVFEAHPTEGLSITTLRRLVAESRGGATGAKASPVSVQRNLDALMARGAISKCEIEQRGGKCFAGWRLGTAGGVVPAAKLTDDGRPDVFEEMRAARGGGR